MKQGAGSRLALVRPGRCRWNVGVASFDQAPVRTGPDETALRRGRKKAVSSSAAARAGIQRTSVGTRSAWASAGSCEARRNAVIDTLLQGVDFAAA